MNPEYNKTKQIEVRIPLSLKKIVFSHVPCSSPDFAETFIYFNLVSSNELHLMEA